MLLYSQSQFDTQTVLQEWDELEIDEVLSKLNGDFRICYSKDGSLLFGRDIFGRKSLCGRLKQLDHKVGVEISAGFFDEKCTDSFEFPPGAIYLLESVSNVKALRNSIYFEVDETYFKSTPLTIHTYYPLVQEHPFYSLFGCVNVVECDGSMYLQPSTNFEISPTKEEVNSVADELIKRLSIAVKSVFEPELLIKGSPLSVPEQLSICFSGGVDSLTVTVLAALTLPDVKQFNLINTVFGECQQDFDSGTDRLKALECFEFLTERFGPRFSMILVNVHKIEIAECRSKIEKAMLPNFTILDESLASVMWFGSRAKGIQIFPPNHQGLKFVPSNVALVGSGADELLGGYARHRTVYEKGGWPALHEELQMEIGRIGARNFGRDDRIALSNGVHLLAPFMSDDFVKWINGIPIPYRVDFREPRGLGEKRLLRVALRRLGLPSHLTDTPKKAMQFGSGYAKLENRGRKGHQTAVDC